MFSRLLQKILPKPRVKALTAREQSGRDNVGYPTMQLSDAIDDQVKLHYRSIKPVIRFYKTALFFKWGPAHIESALNDEQLASLSGRDIQMVYLVLFRDMLRHIAPYIYIEHVTEKWPDILTEAVIGDCHIMDNDMALHFTQWQELVGSSVLSSLEAKNVPEWVLSMKGLVPFSVDTLYQYHCSLVNTMLKKLKKSKK